MLARDDERKLLAYHRHEDGGDDGVVVALNFGHRPQMLELPLPGPWRLRLDTGWDRYGSAPGGSPAGDLTAPGDGGPAVAEIGPYAALVFTR